VGYIDGSTNCDLVRIRDHLMGRLADTDVIALSLAVSVLVVTILPPDGDQKLAASPIPLSRFVRGRISDNSFYR
jgi:hypothetical protein